MYAFLVTYSLNSPPLIKAKKAFSELDPNATLAEKKEAKILLDISQEQKRADTVLIISDRDDGCDILDVILEEIVNLDPAGDDYKYAGFRITSIRYEGKVHIKSAIKR